VSACGTVTDGPSGGIAARVRRIEEQAVVVAAAVRERRLLECIEAEDIQHLVDPCTQQFVFVVGGQQIAFGVPEGLQVLEGLLGLSITVPFIQVGNPFVEIVARKESGIPVGGPKCGLTHVPPLDRKPY